MAEPKLRVRSSGHGGSERWLPVAGYETLYEVSDHGRVRNLQSGKFVGSVDKFGYVKVTLTDKYRKQDYRVHRLVLTAFAGEPTVDRQNGCHKDGNKLNNTLDNLYWGSQKENIRDSIRHKTHVSVAKTKCSNGHLYDDINTRITPSGHRVCRECHRRREYLRRKERRASV